MRTIWATFGLSVAFMLVAACAGPAATPSPTSRATQAAPPTAATSTAATPTMAESMMPSANPSMVSSPEMSNQASTSGSTITVTAVNYHYEGVPQSMPVGTSLTLTNAGTEAHEMLIARRNDDVTMSWQELLSMSEQDVQPYVTIVGDLEADPGQASDGSIALTEEGDYIMVCFIPQGMTSASGGSPDSSMAPDQSLGLPHFMLGMEQEFTVTAAGSTPGPIVSFDPNASPMFPMPSMSVVR